MVRHWIVGAVLGLTSAQAALGNVLGADMQLFNPNTDGLDFVTVESSDVIEPGFINFGLFLNYAVNTLPYFETDESIQTRAKFNDRLLGADFNAGIGIIDDLSLGISFPNIVTQSVKREGFQGRFRDNGNTEVRVNTKYRLWGDETAGIAIGGVVNFNRLKSNPYVGKTNSPLYGMQLITHGRPTERVTLGANIGYRIRPTAKPIEEASPIKPLPNQWIASLAASYLFPDIDTRALVEIYGSRPAKSVEKNSQRSASSSELLVGAKHDWSNELSIHTGLGTELEHGLSTPDWRIYAGVNYAFGPKLDTEKRVSTQADVKPTKKVKPFTGQVKAFEKVIVHDILFEFDSDQRMVGASKQTIEDLAKYLVIPPMYTKLVITGHTDSLGPTEYNDRLSLNRANTIKRWLVSQHKMDPAKIFTEGRGEREPVANNANFQGRQLNRRVEFRIYRQDKVEKIDAKSIKLKIDDAKTKSMQLNQPVQK